MKELFFLTALLPLHLFGAISGGGSGGGTSGSVTGSYNFASGQFNVANGTGVTLNAAIAQLGTNKAATNVALVYTNAAFPSLVKNAGTITLLFPGMLTNFAAIDPTTLMRNTALADLDMNLKNINNVWDFTALHDVYFSATLSSNAGTVVNLLGQLASGQVVKAPIPTGSGGSATNLTPWPSDIDAAGFAVTNVATANVNTLNAGSGTFSNGVSVAGIGLMQLTQTTNTLTSGTNWVWNWDGGNKQYMAPTGDVNFSSSSNWSGNWTTSKVVRTVIDLRGKAPNKRLSFPSAWNTYGASTTNDMVLESNKVHIATGESFGPGESNTLFSVIRSN